MKVKIQLWPHFPFIHLKNRESILQRREESLNTSILLKSLSEILKKKAHEESLVTLRYLRDHI